MKLNSFQVLTRFYKYFLLFFFLGTSVVSFSQHDSTNVFVDVFVEPSFIQFDEVNEAEVDNEHSYFLYRLELFLDEADDVSSIQINMYIESSDSLFATNLFIYNEIPTNPVYTFEQIGNSYLLGMGEYHKYQEIRCDVIIENNVGVNSPIIRYIKELND